MEIGKISQRIDAFDKVTGKALYPGDINLPNQTYAKVLFSAKPHAIVRKIDTSEAESIEGVLFVLTAKDVPNNEYGLIMPDQPVLCGPGSNKIHGDRVRCISDQIAVVVAESEKIAQKALKLIKVTYEDLPVVGKLEEAIQPNAPLVHPDKDSNVLLHYKIRYGEFDNWETKADVIIEGDYETPVQEHAYLQPEAGLALVEDNGKLKIIVAGQWTHEDQEQVAHSLNLPLDQVRPCHWGSVWWS
jgi:CO/xanthine dehydrogenase Mo-binding subunit